MQRDSPQESCAGCAAQEAQPELLFVDGSDETQYNLEENVQLLFSEPLNWNDDVTCLQM